MRVEGEVITSDEFLEYLQKEQEAKKNKRGTSASTQATPPEPQQSIELDSEGKI